MGSRLVVYGLAQAFQISPLEVYEMPAELVYDMLAIHSVVKELEQEELNKIKKQHKV